MSRISITDNILEMVPTTRYQGSKRKILPWIYRNIRNLEFQTVLDGFGGTGSVSYLFKLMGKQVTFNDALLSNYQTGIALIENDDVKLNTNDLNYILHKNGFNYPNFIQKTFKDIYYLNHENKWLDIVIKNIYMLSKKYDGDLLRKKQALAFHLLFQACLAKRPYNLFHRKNLSMRVTNVKRNFGNKKTWDTSFELLYLRFWHEISNEIFSNKLHNIVKCEDILKIRKNDYNLVYLDPPYFRSKRDKPIDYYSMYHFLEGILNYDKWRECINYAKKNRPLIIKKSFWNKNSVEDNLNRIFNKFQDSIIVLSYGEPGYPSIKSIKELLFQYKKEIEIHRRSYAYSLNHSFKNGNKSYEILIIAN
jgi:adenine-specific DNA methylase